MKKILHASLLTGAALLCGCSIPVFAPLPPSAPEPPEKEISLAEQYISMVREWDNPEELASMASMNWNSECQCEIVFGSKKLVSFKIVSRSYTGGAHGMTTTRVGTVRNGRILKHSDLPEDFPLLWQKAIAEHYKKPSFELLRKEHPFDLFITENFYLNDKGIHFIYDPYEIDCYAAGTIDIFVPCPALVKKLSEKK